MNVNEYVYVSHGEPLANEGGEISLAREEIVEYREEFNVFDIARKYAERVARVVDEQTLANVEDQLAGYGYVKVVRCRDCANYEHRGHLGRSYCCGEYATEPDGFCAWGVRKEGGE